MEQVPYEASTRVPLVVAGKGIVQGQTFLQATSLIDLYVSLTIPCLLFALGFIGTTGCLIG